jgi:hypothetical protein
LDALTENKKKHLETYAIALEEYFKDVLIELKKMETAANEKDLQYNYSVNLQKPVNNEKKYDKYIKMFSMTTDSEIVLAVNDFNAIVQDSWSWAMAAFNINSYYSGKALIK